MTDDPALEAALAAIDTANADDPERVPVADELVPLALLHGRAADVWVCRLDPAATAAQRIAARAHHLRRWEVPRASYPEGRAGYLRWRADQKKRHARDVEALVVGAGLAPEVAARAGAIIRKEGLGSDPAVGVHEDAVCLVFLEHDAARVAPQLAEGKAADVVLRTLRKMRPEGRAVAATLDLPGPVAALVTDGLGQLERAAEAGPR